MRGWGGSRSWIRLLIARRRARLEGDRWTIEAENAGGGSYTIGGLILLKAGIRTVGI